MLADPKVIAAPATVTATAAAAAAVVVFHLPLPLFKALYAAIAYTSRTP